MTWLSWRQFRGQALVAAAGLTAVAIASLVTGPGLAHYYSTMVETCQSRGDCDVVASVLGEKHELLQLLSTVLVIVPALVGMFWGAPLVARELETGTYRLVWTQSVTRSRWLALRVAVVGLGSIVVAGLLSLMVTWWSSPLDTTRQYRFRPDIFSERGIVAVGYAACASLARSGRPPAGLVGEDACRRWARRPLSSQAASRWRVMVVSDSPDSSISRQRLLHAVGRLSLPLRRGVRLGRWSGTWTGTCWSCARTASTSPTPGSTPRRSSTPQGTRSPATPSPPRPARHSPRPPRPTAVTAAERSPPRGRREQGRLHRVHHQAR